MVHGNKPMPLHVSIQITTQRPEKGVTPAAKGFRDLEGPGMSGPYGEAHRDLGVTNYY
jgi:hypothetical protein